MKSGLYVAGAGAEEVTGHEDQADDGGDEPANPFDTTHHEYSI